jgi:hypothetical protein
MTQLLIRPNVADLQLLTSFQPMSKRVNQLVADSGRSRPNGVDVRDGTHVP